MPISLSAVAPEREAEVIDFLLDVFGKIDRTTNMSTQAVAWKYFEAHPWWPGSRSYVLETQDGIAAHGCACPVRFLHEGRVLESMQIIDWAGSRRVAGSGLLLYQKCLGVSGGSLLGIGGSEDTLRVLPRVKWIRRESEIGFYARPLRPWRIFGRSAKRMRDVAKAGRNVLWQISPRLPSPGEWKCRLAGSNGQVFMHEGDFLPLLRTREWFDYLLRCPVTRMSLVTLSKNGVPSGHALLSNAGGSVRVADFVVANQAGGTTDEDWAAALSALVRFIAADPEAAEIIAASSLPELCRTFEACGFRLRFSAPIFLADPPKQIPVGWPLEITMMIGDGFYLFDPASPFYC